MWSDDGGRLDQDGGERVEVVRQRRDRRNRRLDWHERPPLDGLLDRDHGVDRAVSDLTRGDVGFVAHWNDVMWPLVVTNGADWQVLTIGKGDFDRVLRDAQDAQDAANEQIATAGS